MNTCSALTSNNSRCQRMCEQSTHCWQHGGAKKNKKKSSRKRKNKEKKYQRLPASTKNTIYMIRGLLISKKEGFITPNERPEGIKVKSKDPKVLDLVEEVLIKQEGRFTRTSKSTLIIKKLPRRSIIYLALLGQYVRWMKPYVKDIVQ